MTNPEDVDTPALLIDADVLAANLSTMSKMISGRPQRLRPHAKTHKCAEIARLQMEAGAIGICCAKLSEAEALATAGISDILVTTPVIGPIKASRLAQLACRTTIKVVADSEACIRAYAEAASLQEILLDVLIEVDVGQNRCGVPPGPRAADLSDLLMTFPSLRFRGLQGYQGGAQGIARYEERRLMNEAALRNLLLTADLVKRRGHAVDILTGGGTGSADIDIRLGGLTELQPGSYVFMDSSYGRLDWNDATSAPPFRSSLSLLTTVISKRAPDRVIVDAGWKAISSDSGAPDVKDRPDLRFDFAGDEHGAVKSLSGGDIELQIGDRLELIPSHCDTTVALHDAFHVMRDGVFESRWPISARGCFQ